MRMLRVTVGLVLLAISPAGAEAVPPGPPTISLTHEAPVPCALVCAHMLGPDLLRDPCASPFPDGSFDRSTLRITQPGGSVYLHAWASIDWDVVICTATEPPKIAGYLASNLCGGCNECRGPGGERTWLGCEEYAQLSWEHLESVAAGSDGRFLLTSFNWLDPEPLPIRAWGPVEVVDDSFEASPVVQGANVESVGDA